MNAAVHRVLVTGGAGFIGTHLVRALLTGGAEVTILDALIPQVHGDARQQQAAAQAWGDAVRFVRGDVRDPEAWRTAYDGQDAIVHLAAETGTGQSMYQAAHYAEVNVGGTAHLIDLLTNHQHRVERVVVASSRSIYGEGRYRDDQGRVHFPDARRRDDLVAGRFDPLASGGERLTAVPTTEDSRLHPSSIYGITKLTQEQLVLVGCQAAGVPATALRFQNVYGPGQSLSNPYTGILSIFTTLIAAGAEINVFEDGRESRDFVYVSDAVDAIVAALASSQEMSSVYNVGSGVATTVLEVVEALGRAMQREPAFRVTGDFRVGDIRHNWADLQAIGSDLGFVPAVRFSEGVERLVDWADGRTPGGRESYERSLSELRDRSLMS